VVACVCVWDCCLHMLNAFHSSDFVHLRTPQIAAHKRERSTADSEMTPALGETGGLRAGSGSGRRRKGARNGTRKKLEVDGTGSLHNE
jgi:hypothetical protein